MNGLSISLDEFGNTEIWAEDVDAGSYHPCGSATRVGFDATADLQVLYFDCSHQGNQFINLYVVDLGTGLGDFCTALIDVQDPLNSCMSPRASISGEVYTEDLRDVEEVKVSLTPAMFDMTDDQGEYAFGDMPVGSEYIVTPEKDDDDLNGISTLDLILIQRHILGLEELDSPYQLIAADVNNSEDISGVDLVELRKLILGIYMKYPENTSWRFVDKDYEFPTPTDPWSDSFSEVYDITSLDTDMEIDFIGVKIGDVNGSVETSMLAGGIDTRSSRWPVVFRIQDRSVLEDEVIEVPVYASAYEGVSGWQMALDYDTESIEVLDVLSGKTELNEGMYHIDNTSGMIKVSYADRIARDISSDEPLFTLVVRAAADMSGLLDQLSISNKPMTSEAYRGYDEVVSLKLDSKVIEGPEIVGVNPNPWISNTTIEFAMDQSGDATWEFYDVNGRLLERRTLNYEQGLHKMMVKADELNATGIIYVRLSTDNGIAEYKMLRVGQ